MTVSQNVGRICNPSVNNKPRKFLAPGGSRRLKRREPSAAAGGYQRPARKVRRTQRHALTLLEVILALAILAISMAAIGELIRMGTTSARDAEDLTRAQILCESKLSEIIAGVVPYDPVQRAPLPLDADWFYSVQLEPTAEEGVLTLIVTVETHIERPHPLAFSLVRWVVDPGIVLPEVVEQPEPSGLLQLNFRVNRFEFDARVGDGHLPVDTALEEIYLFVPGSRFVAKFFFAADAATRNALTGQAAQLVLRDVQPTAVLRRIVELNAAHQRPGT